MCKDRSKEIKDTMLVNGCKKFILPSPHTASSKNIACSMQVFSKRAISVGIFWLAQLTLSLGQDPLIQKLVHPKKISLA